MLLSAKWHIWGHLSLKNSGHFFDNFRASWGWGPIGHQNVADGPTWSILEMSQGLAPLCANSTMRCRVESGSGRPLTNRPPSWLTPLWPATFNQQFTSDYPPIWLQSSSNNHSLRSLIRKIFHTTTRSVVLNILERIFLSETFIRTHFIR